MPKDKAQDEFNLNRVKTYATKAQVPYKRDNDSPSFTGAQGVVYKANLSSGLYSLRSFATKEIRLSGPDERTRLENEIKHLRKCDHTNILKLHEAFRIEDDKWANTYFLVTEPWAETSFQRFFTELGASRTGIAPTSKWHVPGQLGAWPSIVQQCVLGLQHLHNNLIRHKDLKPENILLLDEANGETEKPAVRVIIADLGISKPSIVDTTSFDGTRQYMAPEQLDGLSSTARSDVFSLGACFVIIQAILCTKAGLRPWMIAKQNQTSFFAIDKLAKGGFAPNIDQIMHVLRETHQDQAGEVNQEVEAFRTLLLDTISKMVDVDPQQRPDADALCDILGTYHEQSRPPISKTFIKLIIKSRSRPFEASIDISTTKTDKELRELLNQHMESAKREVLKSVSKVFRCLCFGLGKLHFTQPIVPVDLGMFLSPALYRIIDHMIVCPDHFLSNDVLRYIEHHLQQYQGISQTVDTVGNYPSNNTVVLELFAVYRISTIGLQFRSLSYIGLAILGTFVLKWYGLYPPPSSEFLRLLFLFSLLLVSSTLYKMTFQLEGRALDIKV